MNNTQLKYARERANQIYTEKLSKIRKAPKGFTLQEKIKALRKGEFTVDQELAGYHRLENAIIFTKEPKADVEKVKREVEELDNQYNTILDELILGDNEQALLLLRAFEAS